MTVQYAEYTVPELKCAALYVRLRQFSQKQCLSYPKNTFLKRIRIPSSSANYNTVFSASMTITGPSSAPFYCIKTKATKHLSSYCRFPRGNTRFRITKNLRG